MVTKILVVDDDPVVRLLMSECLAVHGFEVEALPSGQECLEHLATHATDLVVLDMLMPDMSGVEVLRELKRSPTLAHLPVIMLSALNDTEKVIGDNAGVRPDGILQKPFNLQAILEAVRAVTPEVP
ncbi:MAG: phosphate regulon response regulator PhoB [Pseudomonadota bacterium]|jgi:CheY-like chemotaxis protein